MLGAKCDMYGSEHFLTRAELDSCRGEQRLSPFVIVLDQLEQLDRRVGDAFPAMGESVQQIDQDTRVPTRKTGGSHPRRVRRRPALAPGRGISSRPLVYPGISADDTHLDVFRGHSGANAKRGHTKAGVSLVNKISDSSLGLASTQGLPWLQTKGGQTRFTQSGPPPHTHMPARHQNGRRQVPHLFLHRRMPQNADAGQTQLRHLVPRFCSRMGGRL